MISNLSLIAALGNNNAIGKDNKLLWDLPKDMAYFKKMTLDKPILMGRKTYESIGRPLPRRENIILSSQKDLKIPGCKIFHTLEGVLQAYSHVPELMVIGGEAIYAQTLPLCQRLYLTFVDANFEADAFFPPFSLEEFNEVFRETHSQDEHHAYSYSFVTLERKHSYQNDNVPHTKIDYA